MENPSPNIAELLDTLFRERRRPDGREYSYAEVSRTIKEQFNEELAPSYIGKLRNGQASNPSRDVISSLSRFFNVSPLYFFPELASLAPDQVDRRWIALRSLLDQYDITDDIDTHFEAIINLLKKVRKRMVIDQRDQRKDE